MWNCSCSISWHFRFQIFLWFVHAPCTWSKDERELTLWLQLIEHSVLVCIMHALAIQIKHYKNQVDQKWTKNEDLVVFVLVAVVLKWSKMKAMAGTWKYVTIPICTSYNTHLFIIVSNFDPCFVSHYSSFI